MRKRVVMGAFAVAGLTESATAGDTWGPMGYGLVAAGLAVALVGIRTLRSAAASRAEAAPPPQQTGPVSASAAPAPEEPLPFQVQGPADLPTFADVGGMHALKTELKDALGSMLAPTGEAREYPLHWNGLLLHGPPGVGKAFIARAAAGEFGLNLIHVTTADVVSSDAGEAARSMRRAFVLAAGCIPCILFFDEFDSVSQRGDDNQAARRMVDGLLGEVEQWRRVPELIVMAATNSLDALDPAVIRPGHFDRHIRVDLPDAPARAAMFGAALEGRPLAPDVDLPAWQSVLVGSRRRPSHGQSKPHHCWLSRSRPAPARSSRSLPPICGPPASNGAAPPAR